MPDLTVRTGHDTFVLEADPSNSGQAQARFLKIRSGDELIPLFQMAINATRIAGKTITSAVLSIPVEANWVTQTVTIQALDADWGVARVNYTNKPGVTGPTANSGATGALVAGDRFEIDVTALVQKIADGDPNYGWRLTTSQSTTASQIRSFDSGYSSFVLEVEFVDRPPTPTQLSPEGVISIIRWVATVDDTDGLAEIQVQVDATPSGTSPDYDTGWVATTRPKLDLAGTFPLGVPATTYASGLADGASTYWRARVKLLDGGTSLYSSWAGVTRDSKGTIVDDTGTTIYDPSPIFAAHLSPVGTAATRWQVIIADVGDPSNVHYNSGDDIAGATLAHQVPLRNAKGQLVFADDGTYRREIRAWDRADRVPSEGDPAFIRRVDTITLNADGALGAPTLSVAMVEPAGEFPRPRLHITGLATSTWVNVRRDGEFLTRFDVAEFTTGVGIADWDDESAPPNVQHVYTVRAGTAASGTRRMSASSNTATVTARVTGVWLRSDFGDLLLYGEGIDAQQVDKRQTFEMPYSRENVDIVTSQGGFEGTFAGVIDRRSSDIDADLEQIRDLRETPTAEVQLVWGTHNIWVQLRSLSVVMSSQSLLPESPIHDVRFGFFQINPRD